MQESSSYKYMQQFRLKDIEIISGLKSYTIHKLEEQFGFLENTKSANKQKRYSIDGLITLLNISLLYHYGFTLTQIASYSIDELKSKSNNIDIDGHNYKLNSIKLLIHIFSLDAKRAKHHIENLINSIGVESCITLVCYPALNRLKNEIVERTNIMVQKQLLYYLIQNKIIAATDAIPLLSSSNQTIVLFSPYDKKDNITLIYLHYLLRKHKLTVLYLGNN
ncbi:MAG TPA: hypothetical protein VM888_00515, partial [Chitinophagaceae bacterium]|nr:hypothetical protein [Chitinophagaceae bacterium]